MTIDPAKLKEWARLAKACWRCGGGGSIPHGVICGSCAGTGQANLIIREAVPALIEGLVEERAARRYEERNAERMLKLGDNEKMRMILNSQTAGVKWPFVTTTEREEFIGLARRELGLEDTPRIVSYCMCHPTSRKIVAGVCENCSSVVDPVLLERL